MKLPPPEEPRDDYHPSACRVSRFPQDDYLRSAGYEIHARPKGAEAVWRCRLTGQRVGHALAVQLAEEEMRRGDEREAA